VPGQLEMLCSIPIDAGQGRSPDNPGILRLAAWAGYLIAEALEDKAAIIAMVVLGKDILDAAQIDPTAACGAHKRE
jgi:hypothetical protein